MNREIPIFFTIDDGYAPFLAVALNSAIKNADPARQYKAIVLHQELNKTNIEKLKALETENFKIELTPMRANFEALDDRMSNRLRCDYFTLTIYFRLFIPAMFPQYDKGIYIDSDVVLTSDVAQLYDIEIGDNLIGACKDLSIAHIPPLVAYTENAVGVKKHEYINSGVLLMNLKKMRETHFMDKARWNLMNHEYRFPDQMALRDTEDPYPLAETYNFLFDLWKSDYQPAIIHFTNEMSRKVYSNSERDRFYRDYPQFQYVLDGMKIIDTINMEAPYEYIVWGR